MVIFTLSLCVFLKCLPCCFQGESLTANSVSGALCISQPWPGIARSIYGDHKRFVESYFKPYPGQ